MVRLKPHAWDNIPQDLITYSLTSVFVVIFFSLSLHFLFCCSTRLQRKAKSFFVCVPNVHGVAAATLHINSNHGRLSSSESTAYHPYTESFCFDIHVTNPRVAANKCILVERKVLSLDVLFSAKSRFFFGFGIQYLPASSKIILNIYGIRANKSNNVYARGINHPWEEGKNTTTTTTIKSRQRTMNQQKRLSFLLLLWQMIQEKTGVKGSSVNNNNKWMRNDLLVWESCECIHYCSFQLQFHLCMSSAILFARNTTPEKRTQVFFNCLLLLLLLFCLYCKCAVHRLLWLDKPVKCYLIMRRSWFYSSELGIYIFVSSVYVENSYECW